jgi:hypothetical protein
MPTTTHVREQLAALTPEKRQLVQTILDRLNEVASEAPATLRPLFVHTLPRAPKLTDSTGAWNHFCEQAERHCKAFTDVCRALKRLNDSVEQNLSGRVH